jgi:hypothetical protein
MQQSKEESVVIFDDAAINPDGCQVFSQWKAGQS